MGDENFEWPWQYNFPPFFTLQPNIATRQKQFEAWRNLVLDYHKFHKQYVLDITESQTSPLFCNKSIQRKLSLDVIYMILDELSKLGNVEWQDGQRQRCYVFWRTPEEWGQMIYKWVSDSGMTNTVCTLFELTNGDDTVNEEFFGLDSGVLKKALQTLEKEGRSELMDFDGNEGVKFF